MLKLKLQYFGHLMRRADSFEKTLMLGKIEAGGKGDDRGWDGWMASPTQWTWVWVSSGSWCWTGRPGVLRFMGLQRVRQYWATELTDWLLKLLILSIFYCSFVCCSHAFVWLFHCIFCSTVSHLKSQISNLLVWIVKIFILCWCHDILSSCPLKFCGVFLIEVLFSIGWETTSFIPARDSAATSDLL